MSHDCPIEGCRCQVPAHKLMCGRHWRLVRATLQRAVYAAWDCGRGRETEEHANACEAAINSVYMLSVREGR